MARTFSPDQPFVLAGVRDIREVAKLTGADSINQTDKVKVAGTDLGSMFNQGDRTFFVFGDTFGERPTGMTGGGGENWRSNALAITGDNNPADGIEFERFILDEKGQAGELIPSVKIDGREITRIPTNGVAAGENLYLYYMSVRKWGPAGVWYANHSGAFKSCDEGQNWTEVPGLRWEGDSNFVQVAAYPMKSLNGQDEIFFWGIPAGRFGGVKLMKVAANGIETLSAYRYFTGTDERGAPQWSADITRAVTILDDTVGELSLLWNEYLGRWVMTYLRGEGDVLIREGLNPWGPWGQPVTLMTQAAYPGLYGPFMNPRYVEERGRIIYFTISRWGPYNVYWMSAELVKREDKVSAPPGVQPRARMLP